MRICSIIWLFIGLLSICLAQREHFTFGQQILGHSMAIKTCSKMMIIGMLFFDQMGNTLGLPTSHNGISKMNCPDRPCDWQQKCVTPLMADPSSFFCMACNHCEGDSVISRECDDIFETSCCKKWETTIFNTTMKKHMCVPNGDEPRTHNATVKIVAPVISVVFAIIIGAILLHVEI